MMRLVLLVAALIGLVSGCGNDQPENITVLVHVQPSDVAKSVSLHAHALLNNVPAAQSFEFNDRPLDRFWVRFPTSFGGGNLHLDIAAKNGDGCIMWQGFTDAIVGPPFTTETTALLTSVQPPQC